MDYRVLYIGTEAIFGLLFLTLMYLRHADQRRENYDKLDGLCVVFILTIILDAIWMLIDGVPEMRTWHVIHQAVYLSMLCLTGYIWFLYTLDSFPAQSMQLRKYRYLLGIPVLFLVFIALFSFKTGLMYTIDENGRYIRGPIQVYAILINFAYLFLGSYVALYCKKEALFSMDKQRFAVIALYPLPVLLLSIVQFMLPPGLNVATGGALISLLLLFGTSQNTLITRDYLTGLPNRFSFEQNMLERMNKYRTDGFNHLYLVEGDLNKFKHINDTYGHSVGDQALRTTARVLSVFFSPYDAPVFRVGGDEFMVIVETVDPLDYEATQQGLNQMLSEQSDFKNASLSISLGFEEYDGSEDFRSFIDNADRRLYVAKERA